VSDTFLVAVLESLKELFEVVSSNWFLEPSRVGHEVEELSPAGQLENDVIDGLGLSTIFDVRVYSVLDLLNNVGMLKILHGRDLG